MQMNTNINTGGIHISEIKSLFDGKINSNGTYKDMFSKYGDLGKTQTKSIRNAFQNKFYLEKTSCSNSNGQFDTEIVKKNMNRAEFIKSTIEVQPNVFLFKIDGIKNQLVCIKIDEIFPSVKQIGTPNKK